MDRHLITWTAPEPLWNEATDRSFLDRAPMTAPAILRFATDDFMEQFMSTLASDPHRLGEYRVVRETWRGVVNTHTPLAPAKLFALPFQRLAVTRQRLNGSAPPKQGDKPNVDHRITSPDLKLYQPAHQRYYLVTSCLVCQSAGLPDRKVDPGKHEQSGFVMRRLLKPKLSTGTDVTKWPEHAWIEENGTGYWQVLSKEENEKLFNGEEVLPLFASNYTQDDRRQRRLFAGLIPVGKRETYLAASGGPENGSDGVTPRTARKVLVRKEVIEPWKGLIARALTTRESLYGGASGDNLAIKDPFAFGELLREERQKIQTVSWLILLDFAKYLRTYVPNVWARIEDPPQSIALSDPEDDLLKALQGTTFQSTGPPPKLKDELKAYNGALKFATDFPDALRRALAAESTLESTDTPFAFANTLPWPDFLFPLADPELPGEAVQPSSSILPDSTTEEDEELSQLADEQKDATELLDRLAALIVRALPAETTEPQPAVPLAARQPADALEGWFVIRCIYSRPACGKLHDDVVSVPTEPFQLAGFFDPDAPARPIRIGLPIDTTPAGLRKFDRNTAFVISDTLCGQLARMKGLTLGDLVRTVLPWPLHKDLDVPDKGPCKKGPDANFGMICSLSIPIITICALILLMIMVNLLEIVFRWLPYFIVCFPLPGLRAKPKP
jgi:hypothetical protein